MVIIMHSVDNNKITACHPAIPREVSHLLWHRMTEGDGDLLQS